MKCHIASLLSVSTSSVGCALSHGLSTVQRLVDILGTSFEGRFPWLSAIFCVFVVLLASKTSFPQEIAKTYIKNM